MKYTITEFGTYWQEYHLEATDAAEAKQKFLDGLAESGEGRQTDINITIEEDKNEGS